MMKRLADVTIDRARRWLRDAGASDTTAPCKSKAGESKRGEDDLWGSWVAAGGGRMMGTARRVEE